MPLPTGLVVKNGSKIRLFTSAGIPGPLSVTRTTTRLPLGPGRHHHPPVLAHRVEGVVDQVGPHLVQLAAEPARLGQAGGMSSASAADFSRALAPITASVSAIPSRRPPARPTARDPCR